MSAVGEVRAWLRAVVLRRRAEREMQEEMAAHIEQAAERYVARGMSEKEALHAARREFGNAAGVPPSFGYSLHRWDSLKPTP